MNLTLGKKCCLSLSAIIGRLTWYIQYYMLDILSKPILYKMLWELCRGKLYFYNAVLSVVIFFTNISVDILK